jgi:putative transposase
MARKTDIAKNSKIKETYAATMAKRSSQTCRVFTVKVQKNKLNTSQREKLKMMFVEAKWLYNHVLNLSKNEDVFHLKYTDIEEVHHFDKDRNEVTSTLTNLSSQMKQSILDGVCGNIKALAKSKRDGNKVGALRFISEYRSINLKQANMSYKLLGCNKVRIQGMKKPLKVNGLDQILGLGVDYDLANAKLVNSCGDYYLAITVYTPKTEERQPEALLGIDMGCETSLTLSTGEKINCTIEENERLKRLQAKFARAEKGSNNRHRLNLQIRKCYRHLDNCRNDAARKIVHRLTRDNRVVMQDEQLAQWQQSGHDRKVSHGILGRVKALLEARPETIVINKWMPTTKLCRECGCKVELGLRDRVFVCPECGATQERDIHAAQNMLWFYKNNVGVGRTHQTLAETEKSLDMIFRPKQEAAKSLV